MQWLNRPKRDYRRDVRSGLSSDAPAARDVLERRAGAKFFSPEIFLALASRRSASMWGSRG